MKRFETIFNVENPLIVVAKLSILDVCRVLAVSMVVFANTSGLVYSQSLLARILEYFANILKILKCLRRFNKWSFTAFSRNNCFPTYWNFSKTKRVVRPTLAAETSDGCDVTFYVNKL